MSVPQPWRLAWAHALLGPDGFYRREWPADHFRTSVSASPWLAEAVARLAVDTDQLLGRPERFDVVDVGCGDGGVLRALRSVAAAPGRAGRWRLSGVEVRPRPASLPADVAWAAEPPAEITGLVLAHELLDDIPVDVVEVDDDGRLRTVLVDTTGVETLGPPPTDQQLKWLARWWPPPTLPGHRAELGTDRDAIWAELVSRLAGGLAVAVDYAHDRQARTAGRWSSGTLVGYRQGRLVRPVPDGSCDVTAHVALDACAAAGEEAGATGTWLGDQRTVFARLEVSASLPDRSLTEADPAEYVHRLSAAAEVAELTDTSGLGGFGWLLQSRGVRLPDAFAQ